MDNSLTDGGVVEAMGRLSINDTAADGSQFRCVSGIYPGRPGEPDCKYFLRTGTCAYGRNCRFNHPSPVLYDHGIAYTLEFPERVGEPDCGYYLKTGTCKYGAACKFNHPKDKQTDVWMNILGLPMRQDAKPCPFYMRMGVCRYGHACKFHHPQPSSAPFYFPVLGPSAPLPSTSTYLTGSSSSSTLQQWQSYLPAFIYPSQDWSMYMGNVWPSSASHIVTAPPSDDISAYDLPQQLDQPECRYFVNHGSCRYGSNCRYYHPIQSNPIALPDLTPGPGCKNESSSMPLSDPRQANKPDSNGTTRDNNNDEPPKVSSTLGVSPNLTDLFPLSSVASNQNDS